MSRATRLMLMLTLLCGSALSVFTLIVLAIRERDQAAHTLLQLRIEAIALEPQARAFLRGEAADVRATARIAIYNRQSVRALPPDSSASANPRVRRMLETGTPDDVRVDRTVVYRAPVLDERGEAIGAMELARNVEADEFSMALWGTAAGLLALFALATWGYTRLEVRHPLAELLQGIDSVARGDLGAALPLGRRDEIGQLAFRFNEMTARLREAQQEIKDAFDAKIDLEEQVRQSEKLATVGQLAAEIAHEVGTPLGVIVGRAQHMAKKAESPDDVRRNADLIGEQASRIARIIQQLLDYTRRGPPTRGPVDLNQLARATLVLLEHQIEKRGVQVDVIEEELPPIYGAGGQIQQVLLNLMLNAIQAMPNGGTLTVATGRVHRRKAGLESAPERHYAMLQVIDTGVGIPEGNRDRVFEPFFTTKHAADQGTGLGLAVTRGIIEQHDGWIEFAPRPDGGTVFSVFMPLEVAHG